MFRPQNTTQLVKLAEPFLCYRLANNLNTTHVARAGCEVHPPQWNASIKKEFPRMDHEFSRIYFFIYKVQPCDTCGWEAISGEKSVAVGRVGPGWIEYRCHEDRWKAAARRRQTFRRPPPDGDIG